MASSRQPSLSILFFLLACLQVAGLYLFLSGFLLTRITLDHVGRKHGAWERFPLANPNDQGTSLMETQMQPPFERVIVVVIDALRFDFVLDLPERNEPYLNRLDIFQHLLQTQSTNSLLFQFRADPPTTTTQRIKGLMTGSLPTFIDAGSNFASYAVAEDHLPRHLQEKYRRLHFYGDETWEMLFPDVFHDMNRTVGCDSFNMFDLHTVDNIILSHLWPLLDTDSWDAVITHFLGVDHCGHTYGPSHMHMDHKLTQMNGVLERIVSHVDDRTLFVVMGDHGMSPEGNHGGDSADERMSTLFLYSGRPLVSSPNDKEHHDFLKRLHQRRMDTFGYDFDLISRQCGYNASDPRFPILPQVHLAPTLAYLLDLPIPFGNLGGLIPDVLHPPSADNRTHLLIHMAEQYRKNVLQIYDYLTTYSLQTQHAGFTMQKLAPLMDQLYVADDMLYQIMQKIVHHDHLDEKETNAKLEYIITAYDVFIVETIKYCEQIWAQFDTISMAFGIVVLTLCVLSIAGLVNQSRESTRKTATTGLITLAVGIILTSVMTVMSTRISIAIPLFSVCMLTTVCMFWSSHWQHSGFSLADGAAILLVIGQGLTLGSNSFIIWEDRVMRFLLVTLGVLWAWQSQWKPRTCLAALCALAWIRLTALTGQCREEQSPHCKYGQYTIMWEGTPMVYVLAGLAITVVIGFPQIFGKRRLDHVGSMTYRFLLATTLIRQFHVWTNQHGHMPWLSQEFLNVYLPRVVYATCLVMTILSVVRYRRQADGHVYLAWSLLTMWSTVLGMLQSTLGGVIITLFPLLVLVLTTTSDGPSTLITRLGMIHLFGQNLFFVTEHQAIFTSLPWKAAFVGFGDMNYYGGATLVFLSTLTGHILSWLGWFVLVAEATRRDKSAPLANLLLVLDLFHAFPMALMSLFLYILRRHLMAWTIFAPRLLLQVLLSAGTHGVALLLSNLFNT